MPTNSIDRASDRSGNRSSFVQRDDLPEAPDREYALSGAKLEAAIDRESWDRFLEASKFTICSGS